jgi:hypothetical protein
MAEGRQRAAWQHTSLLAAPLWQQAFPRRNKKPYEPSEFDPFGRELTQAAALGVGELKKAFQARFGNGK